MNAQLIYSPMDHKALVMVNSLRGAIFFSSLSQTMAPSIKNQTNTSFDRPDQGICHASSSPESQIFDNLAEIKTAFSQVATHLDPKWRTIIFNQIDYLLAYENWEEGESLISVPSFMTFLQFIIFTKPTYFPSLGVSLNGNLLAAWDNNNQTINMNFSARGYVSATFVKKEADSKEIFTWCGDVKKLKLFIQCNQMTNTIQRSVMPING